MKASITSKVALPIILAGIFILVVFFAVPGAMQVGPSFFIIIFFVCIFIFFYGISTGQKIAFPLKNLLEKVSDLSQGNFKARSYSEETDEVGQLARIFNRIAEELENSRLEKINEEKAIGIKVKARTQELEETISALEQKIKNRTIELDKIIKENEQLKKEISGIKKDINLE